MQRNVENDAAGFHDKNPNSATECSAQTSSLKAPVLLLNLKTPLKYFCTHILMTD